MQRLQAAGYLLVVITNQSGIARGLYTEADYLRLTAHMRQRLQLPGCSSARLNIVRICPMRRLRAYRRGLRLPQAAAWHAATRRRRARASTCRTSLLVGDRATDIQAGRAAGVGRCCLVRSGDALGPADLALADAVFDDLARACAAVGHAHRLGLPSRIAGAIMAGRPTRIATIS